MVLKKIKELLNKDIPFFDKINLNKKYPGYFNKSLLRFHYFLIACIVLGDLLIGGGFTSFSYSCLSINEFGMCPNEFYVCGSKNNVSVTTDCVFKTPPQNVCNVIPCDEPYIKPGHYGRSDFLHKHGYSTILFLLVFAFISNHVYYKLGGKNDS